MACSALTYGLSRIQPKKVLLWDEREREQKNEMYTNAVPTKYVIYPIHLYLRVCIHDTIETFTLENLYAVYKFDSYRAFYALFMEKEAGNRKQIAKSKGMHCGEIMKTHKIRIYGQTE